MGKFGMRLFETIRQNVQKAIEKAYHKGIPAEEIQIQRIHPDHDGDLTILLFRLSRYGFQDFRTLGQVIGSSLRQEGIIRNFVVIKGFLNVELADTIWRQLLQEWKDGVEVTLSGKGKRILMEYPSPNTNKPLHLGHLRNLFLGEAVSGCLELTGHEVIRCNLYNDKGVHICKAMMALDWVEAKSPEEAGKKGDHFVGDLYVLFEKRYKEEIESYCKQGLLPTEAEEKSRKEGLLRQVHELYRRWENGDPEVLERWRMMNQWVYEGFEETFQRLKVRFDKHYYESETYQLGRKIVEEGLEKGIFYRKEDGSVWIDLHDEGLDEKLVLRADGTSVYITQDLGTAELKERDFHPDLSVYVIGNEQDYHMKVLQAILRRLGRSYADKIYHLSYGMVDLPHGRMKSREGTVVDADDLLDEMHAIAKRISLEQGKIEDLAEEERENLFEKIGQAALRFFILKVEAKKRMIFYPEKSIDFKGFTGPFIQYTYARICSLFRRSDSGISVISEAWEVPRQLQEEEREVLRLLLWFDESVQEAVEKMDPSSVAHYCYELAKAYNRFYQSCPILTEEAPVRHFRLLLSKVIMRTLEKGMGALRIELPEQM